MSDFRIFSLIICFFQFTNFAFPIKEPDRGDL